MNYAGFNSNQSMINQLMRQKDNIDNMINQYSQPQQPIQNIINTGIGVDFEARVLKDDEEVENIYINKRTMFLDKKNKRVVIKEVDGKISEEYEIVMPLDEKDMHIKTLEEEIIKLKNDILQIKENAQQPNVIEQKEKQINKKVNETSK